MSPEVQSKISGDISTVGSNAPRSGPRQRINLLDNRVVAGIMRSKWYPGVVQVPVLIGSVFIVYELLAGPLNADENFGATVMWVLWWSILPIMLLFVGRFWCSICPFGLMSDLVQRLVGANREVPKFLRRNAMWIVIGVFLVVTWMEHVWGLSESPRGSAALLIGVTVGAVIFGAFYERRTWCRYVCFVGGLSSNYARVGMLELRGTKASTCTSCEVQACLKGGVAGEGCHMFEFPRAMDSSSQCDYCSGCVKNCPNDSIRLSPRLPAEELWHVRRPHFDVGFLAMTIVGIVLLENMSMLPIWQSFLGGVADQFGSDSDDLFTLTFAFIPTIAAPIVLLALASWLAGKCDGLSTKQNFARFGYSFIPFGISVHIAHILFHLLAEGKSLAFSFSGMFGASHAGQSTAVVGPVGVKVIQYVLIVAGTALSLYTAYRMSGMSSRSTQSAAGGSAPRLSLALNWAPILIMAVINAVLFSMPMAMVM
ncbi:4Fe-4S binding protein [Propionibacterium sp.]|uniref:4Fe-4S binding protein n=1 Tax=Propionibacterium sp. TaxID=1977903 RepID=UPI0039EA1752